MARKDNQTLIEWAFFGEQIRNLRKAKGYSVRQLAHVVGASHVYFSKMESGLTGPPSERFVKLLAAALDCNPDQLMAAAGKVDSGTLRVIIEWSPELPFLLRKLGRTISKERLVWTLEKLLSESKCPSGLSQSES